MENKDFTLSDSSPKSYAEQLLGLVPPYTEEEARKAYKAAISANHPDLANSNAMSKDEAAQNMLAINEAWKVLRETEFYVENVEQVQPNQPNTSGEIASDTETDDEFEDIELSWADLKEAFPVLKFAAFMLKIMIFLGILSLLLGLTYRFTI